MYESCRHQEDGELCPDCNHTTMEEVYMIPQKDLDQLIQYYKGELTENALLNKAATLAAKKHVLLADPQLPPAI